MPSIILHLGLGSFHRAHQAVYLQQLHDLGDRSWVLAGGNLRPDMQLNQDALIAQGGSYTLETVSPEQERQYQWIQSIQTVVPWDAQLTGLTQIAINLDTKIISFTVTEAGYYLDSANQIDWQSPDMKTDLALSKEGQAGSTLYGALTHLLRARMKVASAVTPGPVSLLNCDNLRHNGDRARMGLLQYVMALGDSTLLSWLVQNTVNPNAMVDRITPRPTSEVRARVLQATGKDDPTALMGESFIQWVIEDRFIAGRPDWARVGVELVQSVDAYEEAKIRLLNATHSCIAWAGTLVGYTYIHEGTHDKAIAKMAYDYVTNDTIPVLDTPEHPCPINLPQYRDVVLARFGNPAIADTNQRVAMDGFSKIPGFIAPTIRERLARREPIDSVAMLPALFLAYLQRWHEGKITYTYQDQAMDPAIAHAICASPDPVAAFCANAILWGGQTNDARLISAVRSAYERVTLFVKNHPGHSS
jgi:D-arabinitol 4-dehydrogenase